MSYLYHVSYLHSKGHVRCTTRMPWKIQSNEDIEGIEASICRYHPEDPDFAPTVMNFQLLSEEEVQS